MTLIIRPVTLKSAKEFVKTHHRHNKPPTGWKFGVSVWDNDLMVGVATAGRPVSRHLDDGFTLEVNRSCTDGSKNANSKLYGAVWKAAKAMGYSRCITYTQSGECGASLRAVGWVRVRDIKPRKSWRESSGDSNKGNRCEVGTGGVSRTMWEIKSVKQ